MAILLPGSHRFRFQLYCRSVAYVEINTHHWSRSTDMFLYLYRLLWGPGYAYPRVPLAILQLQL